ncbi:UDP-N-acetylmuramate--L-alanine ligase [Patescibacteria group bacterium]|nr:UDP-N-acetylmuramate--L-alanine ligase [Patescibacteria group bacterium]MBU4480689.1 UDP-N-acetylmuramate--L-alanine ligase [Patescibacteria group bacterium]
MKVHFIGIGGIGVSALAKYYLEKGHKVSGSDLVSSEITEALKKLGAKIFIGHSGKNLPKDTDLVIYSPAVQKTNLELNAAFKIQNSKFKIQILSYPEALGDLTKKYFTIAVCGSHGKSTVTAMIGLILTKAGLDPTVIVGTKVKEFGDSNFRMGHPTFRVVPRLVPRGSAILVIEADEHFASFLNYWPKIIVLTNLEPDHLDFYKNLKNILLTFREYVSHLPNNGVLVANWDDKNIRRMLISNFQFLISNKIPNSKFKILKYSLGQPEAKKLKKILKIPGEFNVSNALAALTAARALKIPDKISFKALSEYRGSWRRFDIVEAEIRGYQRGKTRKITIINDYAHHPTQIKVTLEAAREKYPRRKIWCIFQPHQEQRTYYLWNDFVKVFSSAPVDKIIITDIYDVAGRENKNIKKLVNSKKLVEAINKPSVIYLPKQKILNFLRKNLEGGPPARTSSRRSRAGEVVLIMGAGDIYNLSFIFAKDVVN